MRMRIHRGAEEIGGNCIELCTDGQSLLLDLGAPLMGDQHGIDALPPVAGLTDGTNPSLLGIIISHPHYDHYGLAGHAHDSIPVFIGREADQILQAALAFSSFGATFADTRHYKHRQPFQVGPFTLTPYLADHSAFDAYSFLIEANGCRMFYTGDLRGHGWKRSVFEALLRDGPHGVDALLLEGTTLGRDETKTDPSEAALVAPIAESMTNTQGMILAAISGQNIDRLVTFYKAALQARRTFVVDLYVAHILRAIGRKSLPDPTSKALRVFLPGRTKLKIVREQTFDLVTPYYHRRIYPNELKRRAQNLVLTFRASMAGDLERADCLANGHLIYSMWPGYLEKGSPNLQDWCTAHKLGFEILHSSGHASATDLHRLAIALKPKAVVPIHTLTPDRFASFGQPVRIIGNGEWAAVRADS